MIGKLHNNFGVCSLGIAFTLQHLKSLSLAKTLLIMPIIAHEGLLKYLARKTTKVQSVEQLFVKHPMYFSNFNARFYDSLCVNINSIQFLVEFGFTELINGEISIVNPIEYDYKMGKRARKIFDAAPRIAAILNNDKKTLYTNLRVQI